jgi:Na+/proline symporter
LESTTIWLFAFVLAYWAYCIFWGIKGARSAKTASDYFIAGRTIPIWVFVLAATATSFSGWTFMGHPGLVYRDGFQYAYASFYAITIPFTGVIFLKRQWMIGKRFGFVTPGEMFADYFRSDTMRILTVIVALVFSVPYLGVQLRASGFLFNVLTNGLFAVNVGMWLLSAVVIIYVASGGLRAVAYVDTVQCLLLAGGIATIGIITLNYVGGWEALNTGIAKLAELDTKRTPDGYSHYIAIPGVIQMVKAGPSAQGGAWTGMMVLTYMFALMGIQSAPAFSMWSFSNKQGMVVPALIYLLKDTAPWVVGLLAVCALAAMQSTGAAYMSTAAGMLTRDLYKRFINPGASHASQKLVGRIFVVCVTIAALAVATYSTDALVLLGGLAVAYGFQMWPALIGICWWPFLTKAGVTAGLIAGLIAVTLTETIGQNWFGITAWGRWPLTMHSAGWGIYFNLSIAIIVSMFTGSEKGTAHKQKFHDFLKEHAGLPASKKGLVPVAWVIVLVWFFFGIGPGAVIGNTIFGNPNDMSTWTFGMPSIWVWHIIWWFLGVCMMWFLAYKMQMSTMPETEIVALVEDIGDAKKARLDVDKP